MNKLFVSGDIHREIDIRNLNATRFPEGKNLTKADKVLILGDIGLLLNDAKEEIYWRKWLASRPWTTLVLWGNHENFDMIQELPETEMFGGPAQVISTDDGDFYALKNGNVYNIDGRKCFIMGGAESQDKQLRINFEAKSGIKCWWPQELPTREEWDLAWETLESANWNVDYVFTHTAPTRIVQWILQRTQINGKANDPVSGHLEDLFLQFRDKGSFKEWHFGHMHEDGAVPHAPMGDKKFFSHYHDIVEIGGNNG